MLMVLVSSTGEANRISKENKMLTGIILAPIVAAFITGGLVANFREFAARKAEK